MAMLEVRDIHTYYGNIQALKGVTLEVNEGEIVTLIGSNGAGKSTTLRSISGLTPPREGSIVFRGQDIAFMPPQEIVRLGILQSPEGRHCFQRMSVRENLELGAYLRRDKEIAEDMDRVFDLFPRLKERRAQSARTLSGGEQQMLAVGRALLINPRLLILDEATEGLAPLIRQEIWNCLRRLKEEGQTILVIDKNLKEMATLVDRHHVLEKGRVVWQGSPAELAAQPELAQRYLGV